jgi:hypothetical protein
LDIQTPFWTRSSKLRQLRNRKQRKSEKNTDDRQKPEHLKSMRHSLASFPSAKTVKTPYLSRMSALNANPYDRESAQSMVLSPKVCLIAATLGVIPRLAVLAVPELKWFGKL